MKYAITQAQALAVVAAAANQAAGYEKGLATVESAVATAEGSLANSEAVVSALQAYLTSEGTKQLEGIFGHTSSAVTHTSEAIAHYAQGSAEMAATAARASAQAVLPPETPGAGGAGGRTER